MWSRKQQALWRAKQANNKPADYGTVAVGAKIRERGRLPWPMQTAQWPTASRALERLGEMCKWSLERIDANE